ncbi:hypothetical protein PR048_033022 [Dryococelus australis]|uniref:DDE Tnp4 domain-containing protein n=1 Tax=Dryococelus australis TaxID=614101 RepID=A0ABQ9G3W7_9NEOP|nr:hypothetical protein PR048_033022 [Dryococelus australis]
MIKEVSQEIWRTLKNTYLCVSDTEKCIYVAEEFYMRANDPNCIGALDCKYVRVIKPEPMCSSHYFFLYIDICEYGKKKKLFRGFQGQCIMGSNQKQCVTSTHSNTFNPMGREALQYVIVADEAFGLSDHVMRPFSKKHLT